MLDALTGHRSPPNEPDARAIDNLAADLVAIDLHAAQQIREILTRAAADLKRVQIAVVWPVFGWNRESTLEMLADMTPDDDDTVRGRLRHAAKAEARERVAEETA